MKSKNIIMQVLHEVFNGNAAVLHSLIHMQLLHYRPTHIRSISMQSDHEDLALEPMIGVPSTVFLYPFFFYFCLGFYFYISFII